MQLYWSLTNILYYGFGSVSVFRASLIRRILKMHGARITLSCVLFILVVKLEGDDD
jgi:hypothetical protein